MRNEKSVMELGLEEIKNPMLEMEKKRDQMLEKLQETVTEKLAPADIIPQT